MEDQKKIDDERISHMHGVAEYMYCHAGDFGLDDEEMYVLGLLHDVGYIGGEEGHEHFGGDLIESLGMVRFGRFISMHGATPKEYMIDSGLLHEDDIPPELVLLWEADMKVDMSGDEVGYSKRLGGIANRYGVDSHPYEVCSETIRWLREQGRE